MLFRMSPAFPPLAGASRDDSVLAFLSLGLSAGASFLAAQHTRSIDDVKSLIG